MSLSEPSIIETLLREKMEGDDDGSKFYQKLAS